MSENPKPKPTAIVLLNMGGPATLADVGPFLLELFSDHEIMPLPFQNQLGRFIAERRTPKVRVKYAEIGGGSPILSWTEKQGVGLVHRLDALNPQTAPHRYYIAFRYVKPFSRDTLAQMKADGVERAVAFTQYPHFSCTTTGSSINELWRSVREMGMENDIKWSVIDRWPVHPGFIKAMAASVRKGLQKFPGSERDDALLLFSAHSLPLKVIDRGDPYPQEVGASVQAVMEELGYSNEYILSFQSAVGPVKWLGPGTEEVIRGLGVRKRRNVLVVPIAFVNDHIETLHEIDIEFKELADECGIEHFERAPALNDDEFFLDALAQIASEHLKKGEICSRQFGFRCPGCTNSNCREIVNPIQPESNRFH